MPRKPTVFSESLINSLPAEHIEYVRSHNGLRIRVYPNGTKSWSYFKTAPNGYRKSIHLGTFPSVSYKQARELADRNLGEMLKTGHDIAIDKKGITFGDYMTSKSYISWSKSNRDAHESIMRNLTDVVPTWIHRKPFNLFTNEDFQMFVDDRLSGKGFDKPVKKSTINRNLNNIRSVFKRAFLDSTIKENPMERFQNLKESEESTKRSLTDDERKRFIAVVRDTTLPQADRRKHMEFFVELGLCTGMRKGEMLVDKDGNKGLRWKHFKNDSMQTIDLDDRLFEDDQMKSRLFQAVEKTVTKITLHDDKKLPLDIEYAEQGNIRWYIDLEGIDTKSGKNRKIGVPNHLVDRIRKYLWAREEESIRAKYKDALTIDEGMNLLRANSPTVMGVFDEITVFPFKDCNNSFGTLCNIAGLKNVSIHTMRHDFCTKLITIGIDIYTVKRLAGHADIRTTMKYLHNLDDKDFSALEKLN